MTTTLLANPSGGLSIHVIFLIVIILLNLYSIYSIYMIEEESFKKDPPLDASGNKAKSANHFIAVVLIILLCISLIVFYLVSIAGKFIGDPNGNVILKILVGGILYFQSPVIVLAGIFLVFPIFYLIFIVPFSSKIISMHQ